MMRISLRDNSTRPPTPTATSAAAGLTVSIITIACRRGRFGPSSAYVALLLLPGQPLDDVRPRDTKGDHQGEGEKDGILRDQHPASPRERCIGRQQDDHDFAAEEKPCRDAENQTGAAKGSADDAQNGGGGEVVRQPHHPRPA